MQTKVLGKCFYSVWKERSHKPLKLAAAKKSFSSVYIIDTTCFGEFFLFHVITGIAVLLRFLKQVFWKKFAFYIRYLHNNITMLLIPKVQNEASTRINTHMDVTIIECTTKV